MEIEPLRYTILQVFQTYLAKYTHMEKETIQQDNTALERYKYRCQAIIMLVTLVTVFTLSLMMVPTGHGLPVAMTLALLLLFAWRRTASGIGSVKTSDPLIQFVYHTLTIGNFLSLLKKRFQYPVFAWLQKISILAIVV